ncbi:MAG: hypothetical protein AB1599_02685 [Planctomycetota bacterium]
MRPPIVFLVLIFLLVGTQDLLAQQKYYYYGESKTSGGVKFFFGSKSLDDIWDPVEGHTEIGLKFDFKGRDWPFSIAFDILSSYDTKANYYYNGYLMDITGNTLEKNIGIRVETQPSDNINVFTGAGVSFINGTFKSSDLFGNSASDADSGVGSWFEIGAAMKSDNMEFGINIIESSADITLFGVSGDAGGLHFGMFFGMRW